MSIFLIHSVFRSKLVFISIFYCILATSNGLGYTRLKRNLLRVTKSANDSGKANEIDTDGKYTGGFETDCFETKFITPVVKTAHIDPEPEILEIPKVSGLLIGRLKTKFFCYRIIKGTEYCIPTLDCSKFKLKPGVQGGVPPCEEEHMEVTDGSGGIQRFCGDIGPKQLTTTKGFRDLYINFKGSADVKLSGRGFKCTATCTSPGTPGARALEENSEPDVNQECTCGRKPNVNRIVGGQDAKRGEFPWIVALVTSNSRRPFCGGTVINDKMILTAAHCFKGPYQKTTNFQIVINAHVLDLTSTEEISKNPLDTKEQLAKLAIDDANDGSIRYNVDRYFIHPLYIRQTNDYDVALIKLKEPIDFKKHSAIIQPACIPELDKYNTTYENQSAIVAGWGLSAANATSTMAILQKLEVRIFSSSECKSFYNERISRRMMCAGFVEGGKDSCKGDSGGPLIAEKSPQVWQLIGVVSWGEGCAASNAPGVYQRVSEVNQWIRYISNLEDAVWCHGGGV